MLWIYRLSSCFLVVYDNNHGAEAHRTGGFGLEDSFRPTVHQNTEDTHRSRNPNKASYDQSSGSCIYEKDAARAKPEQMQRLELSVNVPCCNVHLYPKENEQHVKFEAAVTSSQGPKLLVDYDNFPPNKTIGPEMKVVIPPIPVHSKLSRSSPKENGCQIQYPHVRAVGDGFSTFSPIHTTEVQDLTDSDSDWESEAMAGFGGFMWRIHSKDSWSPHQQYTAICFEWHFIYCKIVIKCLSDKKKNFIDWINLLIKTKLWDQNLISKIV